MQHICFDSMRPVFLQEKHHAKELHPSTFPSCLRDRLSGVYARRPAESRSSQTCPSRALSRRAPEGPPFAGAPCSLRRAWQRHCCDHRWVRNRCSACTPEDNDPTTCRGCCRTSHSAGYNKDPFRFHLRWGHTLQNPWLRVLGTWAHNVRRPSISSAQT